jgi:hypothetical protein
MLIRSIKSQAVRLPFRFSLKGVKSWIYVTYQVLSAYQQLFPPVWSYLLRSLSLEKLGLGPHEFPGSDQSQSKIRLGLSQI